MAQFIARMPMNQAEIIKMVRAGLEPISKVRKAKLMRKLRKKASHRLVELEIRLSGKGMAKLRELATANNESPEQTLRRIFEDFLKQRAAF